MTVTILNQMKLEFSPGLELALQRAAAFALREQSEVILPLHLLAGLLQEDEGTCATLLRDAGLDYPRFCARYLNPPVILEDSASVDRPVAPGTRAILEQAAELATWHSTEGTIATLQVLTALLSTEADLQAILKDFGVEADRLQIPQRMQAPTFHLRESLDLAPLSEEFQLSRVIDAAGNRAREALRVLEDHTRFVLNDAFLTNELKQIRHALASTLRESGLQMAPTSRETLHDVGADLVTPQEMERRSFGDIVAANSKRLQESLRSLEEFGKIAQPQLGKSFEALRYRAYTIERALVVGEMSRSVLANAKLYVLVTDDQCQASLTGTVRDALDGGAHMIQLREKNLTDRAILERAQDIRRLTRRAGALFIMNDRPDLAVLAEADGVHLGQNDLPIHEARRIVGANAIVGVSTHNILQARQAVLEGATYLGVGPTFASNTKQFAEFAGLDFIREVAAEIALPFFAIGGISAGNMQQVVEAGGNRVAISHAICRASDPREVAESFVRSLH